MSRRKGSKDRRPRRKARVLPSLDTLAERARKAAERRRKKLGHPPDEPTDTPTDPHAEEPTDPHPKTPREELDQHHEDDDDDESEGKTGDEGDDPYTYQYDQHTLKENLARGSRGYLNALDRSEAGPTGSNRQDAYCVADIITPVVEKHTRSKLENWRWLPEAVALFVFGGMFVDRLLKPKGEQIHEPKKVGEGRATGDPEAPAAGGSEDAGAGADLQQP
jgi:hypothetical protein